MAKFEGSIGIVTGFSEQYTDGIPNGIFLPSITEQHVCGELLEKSYRNSFNKYNDETTISTRFSFLIPQNMITPLVYAAQAYDYGVYLDWKGMKLCLTNISITGNRVTASGSGIWIESNINGQNRST